LEPLFLDANRGKGGAVRAGWDTAMSEHDWVGFVDADGAISASEVCRLLQLASSSPPDTAWFGSRVRMLGKTIERSALRHLSGRVFATLVGLSITPAVYDSQCGIKFVPTAAYRRVASWLREDGFCFDVELLAALLDAGIAVVEEPIDWRDQPESRVSFWRDAWRMFLGVRRIRARRKK
jgi:dolichyl-phosphate beta-glucosyltransferase